MVIGAPYAVTADLIEHFNIAVVCHGTTPIAPDADTRDPYEVPKCKGIFQVIESSKLLAGHDAQTVRCILASSKRVFFLSTDNDMTTEKIVERIIQHRLDYEQRNSSKQKKELDAYEAYQKSKDVEKAG